MWTALCVAMYFFGTRAEITQTPSLVVREDENATLKCSQNDNHNSMYWHIPGEEAKELLCESFKYQLTGPENHFAEQ
ncbi:unnamed protein product [Coccothraustes coccothraustes]